MSNTDRDERSSWWGSFCIPSGTTAAWHLGPLALWIERLDGEWRVAHESEGDHLDPRVRMEPCVENRDLMGLGEVTRYAVSGDGDTVHVTPVLADRPIISRPEKPFVVLPAEEIKVYISTPLWVRIEVGDPRRLLVEIPVYRPSDTWFGPDTTEGEICYATRAAMRLNLDFVPLRAHRAVSAVQIRNRGDQALTVVRLNLPVGYLSLYRGTQDELWTENVIFERPADSEIFQLKLRETAGRGAVQDAELVSTPRLELPDRLSVSSLASLFG